MRTKRRRNVPNPVARGFPPAYDPAFKRVVVLYAEQKGNQEARKRYGISEETIRRWRKLRHEIMDQGEQTIRRSQRLGQDSCSESTSSKYDSDMFLKEGPNENHPVDLDSMPLKQRLSQNLNESSLSSESPLQSLPLSPTKLKVTRQGNKALNSPAKSADASEVCLKWNSHHTNMQTVFPCLLTREQYVDATLVSEGQMLKCHKMILSSCSPYFEEILSTISPFQHPVLFMKDIPFWALKAICDFMYAGEVHISQDKIQDLLSAAAALKIKGLGTPVDKNESKQAEAQQIKREVNEAPTLNKDTEKPLKLEKSEENHLGVPKERVSRRREDRKTLQRYSQTQKDKQALVAEHQTALQQHTSKVALRKVTVATKLQSKPLRLNYAQRKANSLRRSNRTHKVESAIPKEPNKINEMPALAKTNIDDPLDLLQPVYAEVTKEIPTQFRGSAKKMRKRKLVDYVEEREESPPPIFLTRKGTRSRPNVKIPKVFDSHYEETLKEAAVATIVREPHTDQNDPLIGVDVEEIKAEPLDVEESALEVEENLVNYLVHDHVLASQEDEEIIGNFDSPLVNIKRRNTPNMFKKHQPFILDVRTVSESDVRVLDIKKENIEIVDITKISHVIGQAEDETTIHNFNANQPETSQIVITNVQSMADNPTEGSIDKGCNNDTPQEINLGKDCEDPLLTEFNIVEVAESVCNKACKDDVHKPPEGFANATGPTVEIIIKNQDLATETQEPEKNVSTDIKENGLEAIATPNIQIQPDTEELSTPSSEDGQPILTTGNIEAELEQCLASTSTLIKPAGPGKLDLFENEDFTKDVEFEDLSCSKPIENWSSFDREIVANTNNDFTEVEQFSAGHCAEDQNRLEESLLADLDDEMTLKEDSSRANDDPEKTLEMIVQDLNDSLYEMEK